MHHVADEQTLVVPPGVWTGTALVTSAAMLFALGDRPHSYYQGLRWLVLFAAAFGLVASFKTNRPGWGLFFLPLAFVFGPAEFVSLKRDAWYWLDISGAAVMAAASILVRWDLRDGRLSSAAEFIDWLGAMAIGVALAWAWASVGVAVALLFIASVVPAGDSMLDRFRNVSVGPLPWPLFASFLLALGWLYYESRKNGKGF